MTAKSKRKAPTAWGTEPETPAVQDRPIPTAPVEVPAAFEHAARREVEDAERREKERRIRERAAELARAAETAKQDQVSKARRDLDSLLPALQTLAFDAEDARLRLTAALDELLDTLERVRAAATVADPALVVARRREVEAAVATGQSVLELVIDPPRITEAQKEAERRERAEEGRRQSDARDRRSQVADLLRQAEEAERYGNPADAADKRRQARIYGWRG